MEPTLAELGQKLDALTTQVAYLAEQVYLDPHPKELMLRNHV